MFLALLISEHHVDLFSRFLFNTHKHQEGCFEKFLIAKASLWWALRFWEHNKRRKGTYGFMKDEILFGYWFHRTIYSCFMGTKSKFTRSLVKFIFHFSSSFSLIGNKEKNLFDWNQLEFWRIKNVRCFLKNIVIELIDKTTEKKVYVIRARSDKTTKLS